MIYEFTCKECGKVTEINKPISEKYTPVCCNAPMVEVYGCNISAGVLNVKNLPK
jgi:predicted nucleic acid-binding Zn ribbon protein